MLKYVKESLFSKKKDRIFSFEDIKSFFRNNQYSVDLDLFATKTLRKKGIECLLMIIECTHKLGKNFFNRASILIQYNA